MPSGLEITKTALDDFAKVQRRMILAKKENAKEIPMPRSRGSTINETCEQAAGEVCAFLRLIAASRGLGFIVNVCGSKRRVYFFKGIT